MARDDRFKKVQGVGADFLETARAKAEEFLRELSKASGDTSERAQGALDELVTGGRKSTEQFVTTVRKEVQNQLSALGLATRADLEALERRLGGRAGTARATTTGTATGRSSATKSSATKSTAAKSTAARSTGARKAAGGTAKKATGGSAKKATPAKKAAKKSAG